jgi:hypothetical protein
LLHNIHFGADQHVWPLYCIIFCHRSVARGSTKSCVSALVTKTPILLTSKPKVDQALFMACLRCIRCCTPFIVVIINTLGHFVASYFATIVSQEVARGPACQQTLTLSNSLSLSTNLALIVRTPFMTCLSCIRCCTTFIHGPDQHAWPLCCIICCHHSVARGSTSPACHQTLTLSTDIEQFC